MAIPDDGDMMRALGYVTLYAAYLEETIDACLEPFIAAQICLESIRRIPASKKIERMLAMIEGRGPVPEELEYLSPHLVAVKDLLNQRNEFVHGRIYDDKVHRIIRRQGKGNEEFASASSAELYEFLEELEVAEHPLRHASEFRLARWLGTPSRPLFGPNVTIG